MCLALCLVLPFLTGQIPEIGKALSPMHIPVFLCGFLCGWPWAPAVGALAPTYTGVSLRIPLRLAMGTGSRCACTHPALTAFRHAQNLSRCSLHDV